ncbi:MAG: hypothetical protein R3308_01215 [Thiohalobacterales bacterium]|nr:hypothetical protein [Thiohalobacterales bacterium]
MLALTALLCACSGLAANGAKDCPDTRPQVCTMEYDPACGVLATGGRKQYSSPCNACADDAVVAIMPGPCPE